MHVEFLVEEPSVEVMLDAVLPKCLDPGVTYAIHPFRGKMDLLKKLPARLKGYGALRDELKIVVLVDEDRQDCLSLKNQLEDAARQAGLPTKTACAPDQTWRVLNRIVVEELEAWFFGDLQALRSAYPRVPASLAKQAAYRDPDAIKGGTWEALERVLQRAGYCQGGLHKTHVAKDVSRYMNPAANTSKSFQCFLAGLQAL